MNSSRIGKFCAIEGIVRKIADPKPRVIEADFKCSTCLKHSQVVQTDEHFLDYPSDCSCKHPKWEFVPEKSVLIDCQKFRLQEPPEGMAGGQAPASIDVEVYGDDCDRITAGNRVVVNGWLKAWQSKQESPTLSLFFKGNSLEVPSSEYDEIIISEEDEIEIKRVADNIDISTIYSYVAPSVYGYGNIKRAISLQLFGGVSGNRLDGTRKRGDIHILMVGDPGISKSQILKSVLKLCPRGVLTSGKGTSTAGLTAAAVQDPQGGWTLEAGAVVLADNGQLLIDEIDKMTKDDRSALHQAMEQQEVSVAKAGIVATLPSRCSILAAANPKGGRYDITLDIAEQVELTPTLLSRFDLIFLMTDSPDESNDREIATFISRDNALLPDANIFRKYIAYAKRNIFPKLSEEAKALIIDYYVSVRKLSGRNKPMPLTARQYEALVRLSEASARMRLSQVIEEADANLAISVLDDCLKHIAYDRTTNSFDIDKMVIGIGKTRKDKKHDLMAIFRDLAKDNEFGRVTFDSLLERVPKMTALELGRELDLLKIDGVLMEPTVKIFKEP